MTSLPFRANRLSAQNVSSRSEFDRTARTDGRPRRSQPLMRRYEAVHLLPNGDIGETQRLAPAIPAFETAFSAMARGTLLPTEKGMMAIEDLLPGDRVRTVDAGFQSLLWRGSITVVPAVAGQQDAAGTLTRIAADALGIGRPMPDLLLGPGARLHHRAPVIHTVTGHDAAFVPARDFIDGVSVIEVTPQSPVQVFQLGFAGHHRITANGVEIDTMNPGGRMETNLQGEMLTLYLSLFPHVSGLGDFGPLALPRLSLSDIDLFNVA